MTTTAHRTCPICQAVCALRITLDDDKRVTEVRGDDKDPFSQGYICPKGASLGRIDEDPDRLLSTLRTQSSALIEGGLWERVRRGIGGSWFETRLIGDGVKAAREGLLSARSARNARRGGFAAAVQWAPWPLR